MAWEYNDEEINAIIDSNIKSSPPNPPGVNTAEVLRSILKAYWVAMRGQVENAVKYVDDSELLVKTNSANSLAALSLLKQTKKPSTSAKPSLIPDNKPLYLFSVNNDSALQGRQVLNCVYLDGLFNSYVDVSAASKKAFFPLNAKLNGNQTLSFLSSTYDVSSLIVNQIMMYLSALNTAIRYLPIGDSLTASHVFDGLGATAEYWGYASKALLNNQRDRVDNPAVPSMRMLGHMNYKSKTSPYKETTVTVKGGNGAMAGWAGCHYLYHAIRLTGVTVSASGYLNPQLSYYILGLKTQTSVDFTGSIDQQELIRTTMMGKYACDHVAPLYDYMKVQPGWPGANDAYTGSGTQNTNMDTYLETLLDNPQNPFYSKAKARTAGATNAFSLTTYISRWKSKDEAGLPLTVGSTAGSKVTDVSTFDLCIPTHVSFNFGENDIWLFPNATAAQNAAVSRELSNTVVTEYPAIKVGILGNPYPGTSFPNLFEPGVRFPKLTAGPKKAQLRSAQIENLGVSSSVFKTGNIYFIDSYMVTYPLSHSYDSAGETAGGAIDFEENAESNVHLGLKAMASIGDQVYAWLYNSTII